MGTKKGQERKTARRAYEKKGSAFDAIFDKKPRMSVADYLIEVIDLARGEEPITDRILDIIEILEGRKEREEK